TPVGPDGGCGWRTMCNDGATGVSAGKTYHRRADSRSRLVSGRAPRVLVDATAVPADRGGVGRYVDGLISALDAAQADFAVACQRADAERFARMAPGATVVPGPAAIAHRPARLGWGQTRPRTAVQRAGR